MARLPNNSIVTFHHEGVVVGIGFLVGKRRVLTCAHVVNAALGLDQREQDKPTKALVVEFTRVKRGLVRTANVVRWVPPPIAGTKADGEFDVAGLELVEEAPKAAKALRFATPRPHSEVDVYGYPGQPVRENGGWVPGHLLRPVDSGLLQIDSDKEGALRAQPGYSGSPVINKAGRVVGMLAAASILPDQHDCYAIPPTWLRGAWPEAVPTVPENPDPEQRRRLLRLLWRWGVPPVALLLVVLLVWMFISWSGPDPNRADCVPLEVSVSTEKDELLAELAESYNTSGRTFGNGTCARVNTTGFTSGTAMDALANGWPTETVEGRPSPQVWLPSTSMWVDLLRHNGRGSLIAPGAPKRVTTSVLVIAMPERMAKAVRAERDDPGWNDILDLATNNEGWAEVGHPEWGQFVLGRDNPNFSSSGLAASVATYFAAAGKQNGLTVEDLENAEVTRYVRGIDSSVLQYGNEATEFMRSLYDEDRRGDADIPFVSAVLIQEQLVHLYNQGAPLGDLSARGAAPRERMLAVHPREGTVEFDHPYLTLASASVEQRAAAQDFYAFLMEGAQQQRFIDFGFRALSDPTRPTPQLAETVGGSTRDRQRLVDLPEPAMLHAIQDAWDGTRKLARVLLVLDVSGSMNDPANDKIATLGSKLEVLKPAAKRGLGLLGNRDQVGIWTFNDTYREVLPISDVGAVRPQLDGIIDSLVASGDTALHATTLAAKDALTQQIQDDHINAIVLLSDGRNHPEDSAGRARLLEQVAAENQESSVRIFTIPYGADPDPDQRPDFELLDQIAERSKARYYDEAIDPTNIDEVMVSVFSNFGG
jgi:Ca-activated chloride channel homolog